MNYIFYNNGKEQLDGEYIEPDRLYEENVHAGFLVEKNRNANKKLQIPELNSGFDTAVWYRGTEITDIRQGEMGCYAVPAKTVSKLSGIPLTFKCDVPEEGNYQITVEITAGKDISDAMIFLGRRRLYLLRQMQKGETCRETFLANVCPVIARNQDKVLADTSVEVTVAGEGVCLGSVQIEKAACRTLHIAGDSTVTDQNTDYPYVPEASYCGWGQMLSCYIGHAYAISNHAHSGLTTESFRSEGHYQILYDRLRKGDICLIQFGHNDQKLDHLKAFEGYRTNLINYILEIREKGAKPVLVTPLARNSWKGNPLQYNDLLTGYEMACLDIGREYEIPVVALHACSRNFMIEKGREETRKYFFPSDYTHTNDYGAYFYAGIVARELLQQRIIETVQSTPRWEPVREVGKPQPPIELQHISGLYEQQLFPNLERPFEMASRTDALEMVIASMRFFPTNVYNDMFKDVIGHEIYAGTVECAYQNGMIPQTVICDGYFRSKDYVTGQEFWEFLQNGYCSRRADHLDADKILPPHFLEKKKVSRKILAEICSKIQI